MSETTPANAAADAASTQAGHAPADITVLNEIPFRADLGRFFEGIQVEAGSEFGEEARQLACEAEAVARGH